MAQPAENYIPQQIQNQFRSRAFKAWAIAVVISVIWVLAIVTPPIFLALEMRGVSAFFYRFFSFVCHQIPERSIELLGQPMAVCSRCFGIYLGLAVGTLAYPVLRDITRIDPLPRVWLFLSIIPTAIDWSLTIFGIWENTMISRFFTGSVLGFTCAMYIVPAVVEISRNLAIRRHSRQRNIH